MQDILFLIKIIQFKLMQMIITRKNIDCGCLLVVGDEELIKIHRNDIFPFLNV